LLAHVIRKSRRRALHSNCPVHSNMAARSLPPRNSKQLNSSGKLGIVNWNTLGALGYSRRGQYRVFSFWYRYMVTRTRHGLFFLTVQSRHSSVSSTRLGKGRRTERRHNASTTRMYLLCVDPGPSPAKSCSLLLYRSRLRSLTAVLKNYTPTQVVSMGCPCVRSEASSWRKSGRHVVRAQHTTACSVRG